MDKVLLVFAGGGAGSVLRYGLGLWFPRTMASTFPWATFMANIIACLGFALVVYLLKDRLTGPMALLLTTGFCGGLSTFSTFSVETIDLVNKGAWSMAFIYVLSSLILCFLTVLMVSKI